MTIPCIQENNIKEIQKSVYDSEKRDILQSEQILTMQEKINKMDTKMDTNHKEIKELIAMMSLKIDSKLENKADKRTETAVKSFIGIVM
jgi:hypothetical protein